MNHDPQNEDLIDLGAVSTETRGATFGVDDSRNTLIPLTGLTDE